MALVTITCGECGRPDDGGDARGWRAYLGCDEDLDETPEVVLFCPECSAREFENV